MRGKSKHAQPRAGHFFPVNIGWMRRVSQNMRGIHPLNDTFHACSTNSELPNMIPLFRIAFPSALCLAVAFAGNASAEQPGKHPALLHALSDLRFARANLERKGGDAQVKWDEGRAIADIDAAIRKIKGAAIDDGKNLADHPPVDAALTRSGRLHHALEALDAAHHDVSEEEDDAFAQGLKKHALQNIDSAINRTREGLCNEGDHAFCKK